MEQAKQETLQKGLLEKQLTKKKFITMATEIISIEEQIKLTEQASFLKGKEEGKLEIARNLIGIIDILVISEKIGLSIEEVLALKN